ncbi:MAG TPA: hypothetical protein PLR57_02400 [Clostridia bacterium]|nr:hypothetical protein [Clostridia bacterium]
MTLKELIAEVVLKIPSKALAGYLSKNIPDWSIMQTATNIIEHCEKVASLALIEQLISVTEEETDRTLLRAALKDLQEFGYIDEETNRIYRERFSEEVFPRYPFLEKCYLPVLFRIGDVISFLNYFKETTYACIEDLPELGDDEDYTGECYYCHDLDCSDPEKVYCDGSAHLHVPLGVADAVDERAISDRQRENLVVFRRCISGQP